MNNLSLSKSNVSKPVGLGSDNAGLQVFIGNRPPLEPYLSLSNLQALNAGEIDQIVTASGNHWRKIFNCYAKLAFYLNSKAYTSWQEYRDQQLLQNQSNQQLLFNQPLAEHANNIRIVSGVSHWQSFKLNWPIDWRDQHFGVSVKKRLIICPYFDYRQLSNVRLEFLIQLVNELKP